MSLAGVSQAILATAALLLHALLLGAAPFAARLSRAAQDWPRTAPARILADGMQDWSDLLRTGSGVQAPGPNLAARGALMLVAGATGAAWLLVPSFALAMATASLEDPVLAILLLAGGLVAALAMEAAEGRSQPIAALVAGQGGLILLPLALLLAALACGLIATPGGFDAAIRAAQAADPAAVALLVLCLALASIVDLDLAAPLGAALSGEALALWRLCLAARMLVWIDLVGDFLPPRTTTSALAGPLSWAAALLAWALKAGVLAVLLGLARGRFGRAARARARPALLGSSVLLGLLACILLSIGGGVE